MWIPTLMGKSIDEKSTSFKQKGTFDGSRKDINAAIDRICEFTGKSYWMLRLITFKNKLYPRLICFLAGTKIIFWDLREPFIENLYRPSVSQSRLESLIEPIDMVSRFSYDAMFSLLTISLGGAKIKTNERWLWLAKKHCGILLPQYSATCVEPSYIFSVL